jgi:predicted transcriptional regulator YheO
MINKQLKPFLPLVDALAETFGKNCEVVLHDFSNPQKSVIKIANGQITGRKIGSPITDLGLRLIEKRKDRDCPDSLVAYQTKTSRGIELKSTTILIRDSKERAIGCLCINIDMTPYITAKNILEEMCNASTSENEGGENGSPEVFESNVDILIKNVLKQTIKQIGRPLAYMDKGDKLQIIRGLKEKGLFLIKGSAKKVSKELNVSLPTIYKYLEKL